MAVAVLAGLCVPAAAVSSSAFPGAPHSQRFADGSACPAAPANRYLGGPAGCLSVRRADVDGDGRPDLLLLYTHPGSTYRFRLVVHLAAGGILSARLPAGDIPATIQRVRHVTAGRRGLIGIFIHDEQITTEEDMAVYTAAHGHLTRGGSLAYGGSDVGIRFGFVCHPEPPARIIQYQFVIPTFSPQTIRRLWRRTVTTYLWRGSRLQRETRRTSLFETPFPPPGEVGAHC